MAQELNRSRSDALYESQDAMVSHPSHYTTCNGIECIDAIEAATEDIKGIKAVDTANIIKYAWRWNKKNNAIQDVEKIIWYATHLLNVLKEEELRNKVAQDKFQFNIKNIESTLK